MTTIGIHVSTSADTVYETLSGLEQVGLKGAQIFSGNNHSFYPRKLPQSRYPGSMKILVHGSFVINLAIPHPNAVDGAARQMEWAEAVGAKYFLLHAGSSKTLPHSEVIDTYHSSISKILSHGFKVKLLIENTAQAKPWNTKGSLGGIVSIIKLISDFDPDKIGICLDTAHAYAANEPLDLLASSGPQRLIPVMHSNIANREVKPGSGMDRHSCDLNKGAYPLLKLGSWVLGLSPDLAIIEKPDATLQDANSLNYAVLHALKPEVTRHDYLT